MRYVCRRYLLMKIGIPFILLFCCVFVVVRSFGTILLERTIQLHSPFLVNTLLSMGVSVNAADAYGRTPLIVAVMTGDSDIRITEVLLKHHAIVNYRNPQGFTALHRAVIGNHIKTVRLLLSYHADTNTRSATGQTPLLSALAHQNVEIATALVLHNANPNVRNGEDGKGDSPLALVETIPGTDFASILLDHHADVNTHGKDNLTPLHEAAYANRIDLAKLFLKHGADIDAKESRIGMTPLVMAASLGHTDMVKFLLSNGADRRIRLNTKTGCYTAYEIALKAKCPVTAQLLK